MLKRLAALLCALLLLPTLAMAELSWPEATSQGQVLLQEYIDRINEDLAQLGAGSINSLFECYPTFAVLGITETDNAEIPENIELTFTLYDDSLNTLQLRVSQPDRFAALAASCIHALNPSTITLEEAMEAPASCVAQVLAEPANSFEDIVNTLNATEAHVYYAYYPNQYQDNVNWLQMTLVFPLKEYLDSAVFTTVEPASAPSVSYYTNDDGETTGYEAADYDGGTHLEVFTTATPEPDSAAGDEMYWK